MAVKIGKDCVTITPECSLTKDEAYAVAEFIDGNLYNYIRSDEEIDSMQWLRSVLHAYEKMCVAGGYAGLTESEDSYDRTRQTNATGM